MRWVKLGSRYDLPRYWILLIFGIIIHAYFPLSQIKLAFNVCSPFGKPFPDSSHQPPITTFLRVQDAPQSIQHSEPLTADQVQAPDCVQGDQAQEHQDRGCGESW